MDKELIQQVIDSLTIANPKHEEFEKELRELIAKYEHPKPIRLYCEGQGDNPETEL